MGTFPRHVRTREQLLETREGRRALLDWNSGNDERWNREMGERAQQGDEHRAEREAWWHAIEP